MAAIRRLSFDIVVANVVIEQG